MSSGKQKHPADSKDKTGQEFHFYQKKFQPLLQNDLPVLFTLCGPISNTRLPVNVQHLKTSLAAVSSKLQYDICAVFIELYQNIDHYGVRLVDTKTEAAFGAFHLTQHSMTRFQLRCFNLICCSDEFHLRDKLSSLQVMNRAALAARYRAQLAGLVPISGIDNRRTGLGLIDMARRVNGQFSFTIQPEDKDYSLLILDACFHEKDKNYPAKRNLNMNPFTLKSSSRSPEITLLPEEQSLSISGESYPENVTAFYAQLEQALTSYFSSSPDKLDVNIGLRYFNSGSAHALLTILRNLDNHAREGCVISLSWNVFKEDDIGREFAQDIAEQAPHLFLKICEMQD